MASVIAPSDPWRIILPDTWPSAPEEMSFSAWQRITTCPRQWALLNARYSHVGTATGYPEFTAFPALRGWVIHRVLSAITDALIDAGCGGIADAQAIVVLRNLGGFTSVIAKEIDVVMSRMADNFRMQAHAAAFKVKFTGETPAIRERVQLLLSQLCWTPADPREARPRKTPADKNSGGAGPGVYRELALRAAALRWRGIADLVEVTSSHVTITEFKTGAQTVQHAEQLQTYAVLWRLDERLNPAGRPVDRLVLSYPGKTLAVSPPDSPLIETLEAQLLAKADEARAACAHNPPAAKLGRDTCPFCPVRQLCEEYWDAGATVAGGSPLDQVGDCELLITGANGNRSWRARLLRIAGSGTPALQQNCVLYANDTITGAPLAAGGHYRVLNCRLQTEDTGTEMAIAVGLTSSSEVFQC